MEKEDISRLTGEARTVFYRSRFEVVPDRASDPEIWPQIICAIQNWLEGKEKQLQGDRKDNLLETLTSDVERYSDRFPNTNQACYLSRSLALGTLECACSMSRLTARSLVGSGSEYAPQFWALEYVEQDSRNWYRKWCTNIGVTASDDGAYVVNVRVSFADDPTFLVETPWIPPRNTPRFIHEMLDIKGCRTVSNGIDLATEPIALTTDNFEKFISDLVDEKRTVPFVVISATNSEDDTPRFLMDPEQLAKKLRGTAIVFTLDKSDYHLRQMCFRTFVQGEPSYKYGIANGSMRVFFSGVSLDDEQGVRRHHFYTKEKLEQSDARAIANDVCGALTRMYSKRADEVLDLSSVSAQRDRLRREELSNKVKALEADIASMGKAKVDVSDVHQELELKDVIGKQQKQIEQMAEMEDTYKEYIDLLEKQSKKTELSTSELEDRLNEANEKMEQQRSQLKASDYRNGELQKRLNITEEALRAAKEQAQVLNALEAFPSDPLEALQLAQKIYPDKLIFLPEAIESARTFASGEANDVFNVLRTMAIHLWPLYFENNVEEGTIDSRYQAESGYELAFHESSMTNNNSSLKKLRERSYDGKTVDITPHVKGKCGKRDSKFRVHFYVDNEKKLLVIGHCGAHLETAGTRKVR